MKIINCFLIALITLFFINRINCQRKYLLTYPRIIDDYRRWIKCAVYVKNPAGNGGTGTLFSVPYTDTAQGGWVFITTAKHVMEEKYDTLLKKIIYYNEAIVFMRTKDGKIDKRKYKLLEKSESLDVAILSPIDKIRSFNEYDVITPFINKDFITNDDLKIGQTTFIAGYPFDIGGTEVRPVVQSGIISYIDTLRSLVLIDIPVNYGNSGCPVFTLTTNLETKLIGLIFQYVPNPQDVVFSTVYQNPVAVNASLGRVVLVNSIMEEFKENIRKARK